MDHNRAASTASCSRSFGVRHICAESCARPILYALVAGAAFGCAATDSAEFLVFASGRSGNGDIYVVQPDSGSPEVLVGSPAPEGSPRFDPARSRLVHTVFDPAGSSIYSGEQMLFRGEDEEFAPAWSSRGQIAFIDVRDGDTDVYIADSGLDGITPITRDAEIERYPAWHPDGTRLAYAKRIDSGWDLFVLDLDLETETRLTFDGVYIGHPAWSPSGDEIAMDRSYGSQTEIVVFNIADGKLRRLTDNAENDLVPAWSGNGETIAFAGVRDGNWDVWTVPSRGGRSTRVTFDPAFDGGPVFVPAHSIRP